VGQNAAVTSDAVVWCSALLHNHARLIGELGLPAQAADAEVVSAAVAAWGPDAARRLHGPFAFAVRRADGTIAIWRDPVGVAPVYWAVDGTGAVRVDDSLVSLMSVDGVDTTIDDEYAAAVELHCEGELPARTPVLGVAMVPPGCVTRIPPDARSVHDGRISRWWDPDALPAPRRISVDQAADELRSLLLEVVDDVVAACLRTSDPTAAPDISAHLSGGLDSSAIALFAQRALAARGQRLAVVTSWSPDPDGVPTPEWTDPAGYDERELVQRMADDIGVPVAFSSAEFEEADWLAGLSLAEQPRKTIGRESHLLPQLADRGVHHMLSGWGGDEFASFNGRMTTRALVRSFRVPQLREAFLQMRGTGRGRRSIVREFAREGLPPRRPRPDGPIDVTATEIARRYPRLVRDRIELSRRLRASGGPREVQLGLLAHGHLNRRIEAWHEAGRRFGVRYHYPLLDVRLVEWALQAPPEAFRVGAHSRRVFRLALAGLVPDELLRTTKADPVMLTAMREQRARRSPSAGEDA
jgi:asparagine synthase (glutamine-hydrolysing)